jgi:hypothetical protein
MAAIDVTIDMPTERRVLARLAALPESLKQRLAGPIGRLTEAMLARVLAREPSRTGQLRGDTKAFVDVRESFVRGRVRVLPDPGTNFNLRAAALEYGAHGVAHVRAHSMGLDHAWAQAIAPQQVLVQAYQRQVNITALAFLRDALGSMQGELTAAIDGAIAEEARSF